MVLHAGSLDHIDASIYPVFRHWLPASGEELRDGVRRAVGHLQCAAPAPQSVVAAQL